MSGNAFCHRSLVCDSNIASCTSFLLIRSVCKVHWLPSFYFQPVWLLYLMCVSFQFSSVTQLCPTLCNPMNCSTPGLPVYYQLPEFTQTPVHRVSDTIQSSHPLLSPSSAPNPSHHQGLFQ